mgnify:CR=1 FL=1
MDNKQIINMICAFKDISQAQAARLVGRPAQSFNHSIKHNNISLDDFIKLCALMGMTIDIKDAHNNNIVLSLSATHGDKTGKTDVTPPEGAESGKGNAPTK